MLAWKNYRESITDEIKIREIREFQSYQYTMYQLSALWDLWEDLNLEVVGTRLKLMEYVLFDEHTTFHLNTIFAKRIRRVFRHISDYTLFKLAMTIRSMQGMKVNMFYLKQEHGWPDWFTIEYNLELKNPKKKLQIPIRLFATAKIRRDMELGLKLKSVTIEEKM